MAGNGKLPFGDAVAVAADSRTKKGMIAEIALEVVKAENHVGVLPGFVGHPQFRERRTVGNDLCDSALGTVQCVLLDFRAVGKFAERLLLDLFLSGRRIALRAQTAWNDHQRQKREHCPTAKFHSAVHFLEPPRQVLRKARKEYYGFGESAEPFLAATRDLAEASAGGMLVAGVAVRVRLAPFPCAAHDAFKVNVFRLPA